VAIRKLLSSEVGNPEPLLTKTAGVCGDSSHSELSSPSSSQVTHICYSGRTKMIGATHCRAARYTKEETRSVTHATVSARAAKRVHNFNAGPGALPLPASAHPRGTLDWRGSGMSVMEMSHARRIESINASAEQSSGIFSGSQTIRSHLRSGRRQHAVHHGSDNLCYRESPWTFSHRRLGPQKPSVN